MNAMVTAPIPDPKPVRDMLGDLLGRQVEVRPGEPLSPEDTELTTMAVYVDDTLTMRLVGVADLPFAAYAGAAIGLVPPGGAEIAIEERSMPKTVQENFYEVLNICAALFNAEGAPHVKLHAVHFPGEHVPPQAASLACVLGRRLDLEVDIAGYGTGRLSFVGMP